MSTAQRRRSLCAPKGPSVPAMLSIYTIGHSTHTMEHFIALLQRHEIQILVDIRSMPFSRRMPWFTREQMAPAIEDASIRYVWMGDLLGGRPKDPSMMDARGRIDYGRVRQSQPFRAGIRRLLECASEFPIAVMCAEEDPGHCHRYFLLGPTLLDHQVEVLNIRGDGRAEPMHPHPPLFQA